ncbi:hypothetical protein QYE76_004097 [Lolium multiflorum]|uniref:Uncharacterized protein n=1 Tax=Lolium multiflorum TaxID=4521 RepID=A0AAD8RRX2_LOLMU|nr:hypothetical protein QYE76_004097 [Lolium multiflorum]
MNGEGLFSASSQRRLVTMVFCRRSDIEFHSTYATVDLVLVSDSAVFAIDFKSSDAKTPFRVSLNRRRTRLHCNEGASIETNAAWLLRPHLPCSLEGNESCQRIRVPPVEREDQAPARSFKQIRKPRPPARVMTIISHLTAYSSQAEREFRRQQSQLQQQQQQMRRDQDNLRRSQNQLRRDQEALQAGRERLRQDREQLRKDREHLQQELLRRDEKALEDAEAGDVPIAVIPKNAESQELTNNITYSSMKLSTKLARGTCSITGYA